MRTAQADPAPFSLFSPRVQALRVFVVGHRPLWHWQKLSVRSTSALNSNHNPITVLAVALLCMHAFS